MSTFVLVPGAWLGAWSWQRVARLLRDARHDVYPLSLTGLGERVHLGGSNIRLDTHIDDVVNLIRYENLADVVLVGHSYAGIVVTGVADRIPERIAQVIYVDSGPVPDGARLLDLLKPELRERQERQVAETGGGWRLAMPPDGELGAMASLEGLDDDDLQQMRARAVDHPFGTYTQPLRLNNSARAHVPKVLISNSLPLDQVRAMIEAGHPAFNELSGPEWTLCELRTGHWPMFSAPDQLAGLLNDLASTAAMRPELAQRSLHT